MHQVKCIEKIRDKNNHIIGYTIIGEDKKAISVKSDDLKESIRSGQIEVINLTLTSDNRIIDKKPDALSKPTTTQSSKPNVNIESLINRIEILGYILNTFDTDCGHKCYIASSPDNSKHLFIIPDDVEYIYNLSDTAIYSTRLHKYLLNIKGTLKVIGGKNLVSARCMFKSCRVHSIDFSAFDTSNVTDMGHMFCFCETHSIDLRSFDTSKVTTMDWMFNGCKAQFIDLSSFDTSKVTNIERMFTGCKAQYIDLSSFNTRNVTNIRDIFFACEAQIELTDYILKYLLQTEREP